MESGMKSDLCSGVQAIDEGSAMSVSCEEAMAELQRVMESPDFVTSPRNRAFLKLVVESTLQGRRVTGYDVAVQAFHRPRSFDAAKDPIVRIECSKLRKALEVYYLKSGRQNPVRLDIPKGSYSAMFQHNGKSDAAAVTRLARIDARWSALLRAAIAGWAGESVDGPRAWRELQLTFPGFPFERSATELLHSFQLQDPELHDLLEEGLRRLERHGFASGAVLSAVG